MKRKERHLDCQSKKDSGEGEPFKVAAKQVAGFCQVGQADKIERAPGKIDPEEREQHRHASKKGIKKEFCGGADAFFPTADLNKDEGRDEAHPVGEKLNKEILRDDVAV